MVALPGGGLAGSGGLLITVTFLARGVMTPANRAGSDMSFTDRTTVTVSTATRSGAATTSASRDTAGMTSPDHPDATTMTGA